VRADLPQRARALDVVYEERAPWLFRDHPMLEGPDVAGQMTRLLADEAVARALELGST
jgi:hypothetical protein